MSRDINLPLNIGDIDIDGGRTINAATVKTLALSIERLGLRYPITVREKGERYVVVAGRHRIEAFKKLGRDNIPATIVKMSNDDARLWEISENLHRSDLTKLERDEQLAEWIRITERIANSQNERLGGRPPGIEAAARELGIERQDAHRAVKVASLSDEAKQAARDEGLENNRSALLEAASKPTVAEQVAAIHNRHTAKVIKLADAPLTDVESTEKQLATLMAAWNRTGPEARAEFLALIDNPVMDARFA